MATLGLQLGDLNITSYVTDWTESFPKKIKQRNLVMADGTGIYEYSKIGARKINLNCHIKGSSYDDLRTKMASFLNKANDGKQNLYLYTDRKIEVILDKISNIRYNSYFTAQPFTTFSASFIAAKGYWEKTTEGTDTESVTEDPHTYNVTNSGSLFVFPKIEVTAAATITTLKITNNTNEKNFAYNDTNFTNTKKATINGTTGEVDLDDVDTIRYFNGYFLTLDAGVNSIKVEGGNCSVKFSWYERFL